MLPLKQADRLPYGVILCQAVDTYLFFRHSGDRPVIYVTTELCRRIQDCKFVVRQYRQAAFSHLGISQRSEISIDYLLHGGASDHMAVESLRESHIDHIRLLSLYRQHGIIVRLCSQPHRNSSVVHDKIVQYLVFFLSAVFQIVQADPFR